MLSGVAFLAGALFAVASFGTMALDPSAVQWLLISDRGQSFIGWHMARNAPASFPLGAIPDYVVPGGASLAMADAIPAFSLLLLPFSALLPRVFQHAGMWLVLCYGLMGLFSFRLLRRLTNDDVASLVGALLVVVNPVLLFRRFHLSLCAQWMIVAALLLYAAPPGHRARRRVQALLLVVLACGTHPYLAIMVLGIVAAAAWAEPRSWREAVATCALYVAATIGALWAFGYLGDRVAAAPGFGGYSANLLALIDSDGWSQLVPDLPSGPGEYEGFAFVGLGGLAVLVLDLGWGTLQALRGRAAWPSSSTLCRVLPLLLVTATFTIFALSSHVRFGATELADLTAWYAPVERWASSFRASGRFIWPLYYLLLFVALAQLWRLVAKRKIFVALVLGAVALQLADAWPRYSTQHVGLMALTNPHRPLRDTAWRGIGRDYREIRLIPPSLIGTTCDDGTQPRFHYMPFAFVAGLEGMRINSGHLSRYPRDVEAWCRAQTAAVREGRIETDVVYVLSEGELVASGLDASSDVTCGILDGHHVCVAAGRDTALARALLRQQRQATA